MYVWSYFKEILAYRLCMTPEELDMSHRTAMELIKSARNNAVRLDDLDLADMLKEKYCVSAQERIYRMSDQEYHALKAEAANLAWDYVYAIWDLEPAEFDLVFLCIRYYMIYPPELISLALHSPTARENLLDGVLMTEAEMKDLAWSESGVVFNGDGDGDGDDDSETEEEQGHQNSNRGDGPSQTGGWNV